MVAEFVEEVEIVGSLEDFNKFNDVRGLYFREHFDFIERALLQFRVLFEFLNVDDFDSDFLLVARVDASVDFAVLALANLLVQGVIFNHLDHSVRFLSINIQNVQL